MIKRIPKVATITVVLLVILMASLTPATVAASPQQTMGLCQCVKFVTNTLFGIDNIVTVGSWSNAQDLANQTFWDNAYNQKLTYKKSGLGLYTQIKNPVTAQANDVMIMRQDARVYIQMTNGAWDYLTYVGGGSGHIGFVVSAKYYDKNFNMNSPKLGGLSGWLITMQSANWGTKYNYTRDQNNNITSALTDINLPNPYSIDGKFFSKNDCSNITNSVVFLPTGNPVSIWRLQK